MIKYLPNALTILRIILVPVFLYLAVFAKGQLALTWALTVFVLASVTDWLDGLIARKYNIISNFGKIWDPLADKLIVLSALGVLTWASPYHLPWLIFAIIALREIWVTILRDVYARRKIIIPADRWGKLKTVMQMLGLIFFLFCWVIGFTVPMVIAGCQVWFWLTALVTLFSGVNYLMVKKINTHT